MLRKKRPTDEEAKSGAYFGGLGDKLPEHEGIGIATGMPRGSCEDKVCREAYAIFAMACSTSFRVSARRVSVRE